MAGTILPCLFSIWWDSSHVFIFLILFVSAVCRGGTGGAGVRERERGGHVLLTGKITFLLSDKNVLDKSHKFSPPSGYSYFVSARKLNSQTLSFVKVVRHLLNIFASLGCILVRLVNLLWT